MYIINQRSKDKIKILNANKWKMLLINDEKK